ncbi:MAG: YfiR family protein [Sphingobacteriia bacterium]|nr:YfiR family protein [Sphingobacteriia bacterium]
MKHLLLCWFIAQFAGLLLVDRHASAQVTGSPENIMGSFIYHFTEYLSWPENEEEKSFRIIILGDSPLLEPLQYIAAARVVNNQPILVKHIHTPDEIEECHMLVVADELVKTIEEFLDRDELKKTVFITHSDNALKHGASINFVTEKDKIRFEINRSALELKKIKVSSQLLKLALKVI